ncbi:MAG: TM0106 family RecB-like putative nuclease [Leptolyngbyaceae cyanobacterium SL_7_1]|nr:TM0106 family RecB-like putative nuclease [Leptolyngbyaceae cyanobacterium SL_7_1]
MWITDEVLFNYQRCHRRAFLDVYGEARFRDPPSDYLSKLRQDSLTHQQTVLGEQSVHIPNYRRGDWQAGAEATLALMQQGVDRIAKGVLLTRRPDGVVLQSCPDLLVKQPGYSNLGNWLYAPIEIKLGKRPKLDYQIIATFHTYILATVQGAWAEAAWLVLRHRGLYEIDLVELLPKLEAVLEGCVTALANQQEPEVFIAHSRCDLCHWFSHCYGIAEHQQHLSLLPGVTPSRYLHLKALDLVTVEALAEITPKQIEMLPGFGIQVAQKLVQQAQSTLHNQALLRHSSSPIAPLVDDELPTAAIELYFDIEAAPEQNLVYLHGVLVVDRLQQTETFHGLLADHPAQEKQIWQQFLELVWQYPTAPIFHFCPYEVQTVRRLAIEYDTPVAAIDPLVDRFVDLHERVTRLVTLPIESYALKPIARWLGFDWRDADANGAQSIYWYAQWLTTQDRTFLNAILRYNEDDCRATHRVKDWLVEFIRRS